MSYYNPYQGDYKTYGYAGDPGFLSGLWKGIKSVGLGLLGGMAAPAPKAQPAPVFLPAPTGISPPVTVGGGLTFPGGMRLDLGAIVPKQGRLPPFTARGPGVLPAGGRGGQGVPSGYHFAKDGSGRLVRNRRMNVANPRALRRSMRRLDGFEKLARRVLKGTHTIRRRR